VADAIQAFAFETQEALESAAASLIRDTLKQVRSTPSALFLSGGNTPREIYRRIQADPCDVESNVYIGYADERHVPPDSPESNYGMTRDMLKALRFPNARILCVETEHVLQEAAFAYHETLTAFFDQGGSISLGILGIGADGHTCSLFTEDDLRHEPGQLAIPVVRGDGLNRVSVTPELLQRMEQIVILAAGAEKADVAEILLTEPEALIAGQALAGCPNVHLWIA
jgi:6-phosphogluconolactonase